MRRGRVDSISDGEARRADEIAGLPLLCDTPTSPPLWFLEIRRLLRLAPIGGGLALGASFPGTPNGTLAGAFSKQEAFYSPSVLPTMLNRAWPALALTWEHYPVLQSASIVADG